jgi:hypothetical protein
MIMKTCDTKRIVNCSVEVNPALQRKRKTLLSSRRRKLIINRIFDWYNTVALILLVCGGGGIRRITLICDLVVVHGQALSSPAATVSTLQHASTQSQRDRRIVAFPTITPKFPIRIDCGTSTYIDPKTKIRWRGGASYIQDRSLSRNYRIRSTETITIPSSLLGPNATTVTSNNSMDMENNTWMLITAAPNQVYRTHKYYQTFRTTAPIPSNETSAEFQFNVPVESSFMNKSDNLLPGNTASDFMRVYTVRLHFAETVRLWLTPSV